MTKRSDMLAKEVELAASRERAREERDLGRIAGQYGVGGAGTSGAHVQARHRRRLETLRGLLALRLRLERETPIGPEDESSWYDDLRANIQGIIDRSAGSIFKDLDEDAVRFGGGPLSTPWHAESVTDVRRLREQYLKEAEILSDRREHAATIPKVVPMTNVTFNISQSSIANLNVGNEIGHIENIVGRLQERGLQDLAGGIKALTEAILASPQDTIASAEKRQAVELVEAMSEEFNKPPEQRRGGLLHAVGSGLLRIVRNIDKVAACYDLVRIAAKSQGVELP